MTEHILRALGETDERYFLAYAEKVKEKSPKRIVLRRWLSIAAAVIVIIGITLALPPVRQTLFPKTDVGVRWDFDSFEEMMGRAGSSPKGDPFKGNIPYDTHLSSLDFSRFDNEHFYICLGDWGDMAFSLAMGPPPVYVCELEKDGVAYEIAHYRSVNSMEMPERFRNTEKYPDTERVGGIPVSYQITRNRAECEFTDVTGYYKIICHTGDKKALSDIVEMLLGSPLSFSRFNY